MDQLVEPEELSSILDLSVLIKCLQMPCSLTRVIPGSLCLVLPEPSGLSALTNSLQLPPYSHLVLYDDGEFETAATLWWALKQRGIHSRVLNGGLAAWRGNLFSTRPEFPTLLESASEEFLRLYLSQDEVQSLRTAFRVLNTSSAQVFSASRRLKPTMELAALLKAAKVSVTDEELVITQGEYAHTLLFVLSIFERQNIGICQQTDRSSSSYTRFYSFEDSQPASEMSKHIQQVSKEHTESASTQTCHCCVF